MCADPFFSIVLPTRDRPELVRDVLSAMTKQEYKKFEIIVSDNYLNKSCFDVVRPFLNDDRVVYKTPEKSMNMCDHWEFAVNGCVGDYVTVINEKLVFRPDALLILSDEIKKNHPDVISWHYDVFATRKFSGGKYYGHYHPLIKPRPPSSYSSISELNRRFRFDFPEFSRYRRVFNNYSRIYTSFIKKTIISEIKSDFGGVFKPISPDFTSLVYILGYSKTSIDVGQPLMFHNYVESESNGASCTKFIANAKEFLGSLGYSYPEYLAELPIKNLLTISNSIAMDYASIEKKISEKIGCTIPIDRAAVAFWSRFEVENYIDISRAQKKNLINVLDQILVKNKDRVIQLEHNNQIRTKGSSFEIYHSGLRKIDNFKIGTSAKELAEIHWIANNAPPRVSVFGESMEFSDAFDYYSDYHMESNRLLGL